MARFLLSIRGITARGRHGANPGERDQPQEFRIDVEAEVEVRGDSLDATVDYRTVTDVARKTVETSSFELLESLAEAVAAGIGELAGVVMARVTVHKPSAAGSIGVEDVAATATSAGTAGRHGD